MLAARKRMKNTFQMLIRYVEALFNGLETQAFVWILITECEDGYSLKRGDLKVIIFLAKHCANCRVPKSPDPCQSPFIVAIVIVRFKDISAVHHLAWEMNIKC